MTRHLLTKRHFLALIPLLFLNLSSPGEDISLGIIGLDTSHSTAFTEILHNPAAKDHVPGARVVAAFPGGSPDIPSSIEKVPEYTAVLRNQYGVAICETIEEVCAKADAILIESVDGRPHLEQARIAIMAGKPLYIDKPLAGSLRDALEIIKLAQEKKVPLFTSSSLRFAKNTQSVRNGLIGKITEASTTSPCHLEPHHPDLYWYGIHGCESLFTIMGTGCETVTRTTTPEGLITVTGLWKGGRKGTFTEGKTYSGLAQGEKGTAPIGSFDGYAPLVVEIVKFFKTGQSPVPIEETIELLAFMEAADESKRQNGAPVSLEFVLEKARKPLP